VSGRGIFESVFWVLLSVLMFVGGTGFAIAAPFVMLAAPAPFMLLTRRLGFKIAAFGALAGSAAVYSILGPAASLVYLLMFALTGAAFSVISFRAKSGVDFILSALTASIAVKIVLMVAFTRAAGVNPFSVPPDVASQMLKNLASSLSAGGVALSDSAINDYAAAITETVSTLMPSMLILFSAGDTFVTYAVVSYALNRLGSEGLVKLPPFGAWRFPKDIFWALLAALIVDFAGKSFPEQRVLSMLSANLMEVLRGIFLIEGISLCWYYMTRRGINRGLKMAAALFCMFFPPVSYILSMVGIFDIWYDLRNRVRRK